MVTRAQNLLNLSSVEKRVKNGRKASSCRCFSRHSEVSVNDSVRHLNQEKYRGLAFNDAFEQIWVISKARRHVGKLVSELQKEV